MNKKTLVVNLCAGPGAGKSTNAARVFAMLKDKGIDCELATEYAKDKVWEESYGVFKSQIYVFGKQYHRLNRLNGKVDVIVTDAPLIHSLQYDNTDMEHFKPLVIEAFNSFENATFFLSRIKEYNPNGRMQTKEEAKVIDYDIINLLLDYGIEYETVPGTEDGAKMIVENVLLWLQSRDGDDNNADTNSELSS